MKIDDDIVYIAPEAIYKMAILKLTSTFMFISANVVNHAAISAYHTMLGIFNFDEIRKQVVYELEEGNIDAKLVPLPPFEFDGDAWGDHSWRSGPHALLQHFMFFYFNRVNDPGIYDVGDKDMDMRKYYRWSINFFMFSAKDMRKFDIKRCGGNDELYLSMFLPHDMNKHSAVAGNAVVCHFAYHVQR